MARIRYQVAMSLDGFIAGPKGEADWITMDPDIDFKALFAQFDTFLMGRKTFEAAGAGGFTSGKSIRTCVFSRTLRPEDHPKVTIVREVSAATVADVRSQAKKDLWLFGGGSLFRSFLDAGLVDTVEVAVIPILLGDGIPLLPAPARRSRLRLTGHRVLGTGIVQLEYAVGGETPVAPSRAKTPRRAQKRRRTEP